MIMQSGFAHGWHHLQRGISDVVFAVSTLFTWVLNPQQRNIEFTITAHALQIIWLAYFCSINLSIRLQRLSTFGLVSICSQISFLDEIVLMRVQKKQFNKLDAAGRVVLMRVQTSRENVVEPRSPAWCGLQSCTPAS